MKYSLIIPIYNEEQTLNKLLTELKSFQNSFHVILVNDGSTDNSGSILRNQKSFKVIHNSKNMGKGYSLISAMKIVSSKNVILMDGDLEIDLRSIPKLVKEFEKNNNYVIVGKRWNKESNYKASINTYGNYLINYIFNMLYGTELTDVLCCVKIIKKDLLRNMKLRSIGFNIEMEIMAKLVTRNIKILEQDVLYNRRSYYNGKKLKLSDAWGIIFEMFKIKYENVRL